MNKQIRTTRTHALLSIATCSLLAMSAAHAADSTSSATGGNVPSADRTFIEKAAISDMTEISASKLAQEKGSSPAIKQYGAQMITDHTKSSEELMKIAAAKGVTPPGTVDKAHHSALDKLAKLSGTDFDKAYTKQMVADHKVAVALFEKEAKSGKDADLQAFAGKTLPILQNHLGEANATYDRTK